MGKSLSLTVVAQGVETKEQADFLREHACDELQGFYFNKPVSAQQFTSLLQERDTGITLLGEVAMANVKGGEQVVGPRTRGCKGHAFAIHGAHLESLFQSCLDHGIAITDVRHEAATGHARGLCPCRPGSGSPW